MEKEVLHLWNSGSSDPHHRFISSFMNCLFTSIQWLLELPSPFQSRGIPSKQNPINSNTYCSLPSFTSHYSHSIHSLLGLINFYSRFIHCYSFTQLLHFCVMREALQPLTLKLFLITNLHYLFSHSIHSCSSLLLLTLHSPLLSFICQTITTQHFIHPSLITSYYSLIH